MKIGLDARWIFRELSGIGSYTRELIRQLARLAPAPDLVLYFQDPALRDRTAAETGFNQAPHIAARLLPYGLFSVRNQWLLPRRLAEDGVEVFHSPNYMIPLRAFPRRRPGRIRCVVTIHDLIPLMHPDAALRARKRRFFAVYRRLMLEVAARADLVLTDSRSGRQDAIRCLGLAPERVLAIPLGVRPAFQPAAGPRPARSRKTLLWVGRADPYKNLAGMIEAFARLRRKSDQPVELRVVCPADARYPEAARRAAELGLGPSVVWLGYVPDNRLLEEYRGADVFIQTSRHEGFGLPVLEAMACGTPVVCSDRGSLPEVAGPAALFASPDDPDAVAEAVRRVLDDPRLAGDLRARGLRQAQAFTWEACARRTLAAYAQAAALEGLRDA